MGTTEQIFPSNYHFKLSNRFHPTTNLGGILFYNPRANIFDHEPVPDMRKLSVIHATTPIEKPLGPVGQPTGMIRNPHLIGLIMLMKNRLALPLGSIGLVWWQRMGSVSRKKNTRTVSLKFPRDCWPFVANKKKSPSPRIIYAIFNSLRLILHARGEKLRTNGYEDCEQHISLISTWNLRNLRSIGSRITLFRNSWLETKVGKQTEWNLLWQVY